MSSCANKLPKVQILQIRIPIFWLSRNQNFKNKSNWNFWNRKQNRNSASDGGPRNRNWKLELPTKHGPIQIHATTNCQHARWCHQALPSHRPCNTGQICLLQNPKGNVWPSTGWNYCAVTAWETTTATWIPSKQNNTRLVETGHTTNFLHPSCWQLWGRIRWERECTAPTWHGATVLQMLVRLGWWTILWPHHQVGLQRVKGPPIDAQLHQQSPCLVPAHSPTKMVGRTISPCQAHIWGKEAIFTSRRRFPCPQQGWKEIHLRSMQSFCTLHERLTEDCSQH